MSPTDGFFFEVFANSNASGAIDVGEIYADNFSLTAVPAPAGLLLVLAGTLGTMIRRRRAVP